MPLTCSECLTARHRKCRPEWGPCACSVCAANRRAARVPTPKARVQSRRPRQEWPPERRAELVRLRRAGRTFPQIAEILGAPVGSVATIYRRECQGG